MPDAWSLIGFVSVAHNMAFSHTLRERRALHVACARGRTHGTRHLHPVVDSGRKLGASARARTEGRRQVDALANGDGPWPPERRRGPSLQASDAAGGGRTVCDAALPNPTGCGECILTETFQKEQQRRLNGSRVDLSRIEIHHRTEDEMHPSPA
jgi:hypothetical protein